MKKNWIMRSAYLVLAVLLISTVAVSGTFAKYTWNSNDITDSAKVAKFKFQINDAVIDAAEDTVSIDLFNTILDTNGSAETDVRADMIAPGTQGAFDLSFQNLSDVTVAVDFAATVSYNPMTLPLEFTLTPDVADSWKTDAAAVIDGLDATTVAMDSAATGSVVYWRWAFEEDDDRDTNLGFLANAMDLNATLTVDITVNQVD